jgi:hypothetical protein
MKSLYHLHGRDQLLLLIEDPTILQFAGYQHSGHRDSSPGSVLRDLLVSEARTVYQ